MHEHIKLVSWIKREKSPYTVAEPLKKSQSGIIELHQRGLVVPALSIVREAARVNPFFFTLMNLQPIIVKRKL